MVSKSELKSSMKLEQAMGNLACGGWRAVEISCAFFVDFCWEFHAEKWSDHRKKKFFTDNSFEALIPFKEEHQGLLKLHYFFGE